MRRLVVLSAVFLCATIAHAAVEHLPIKSNVPLKPGEAYTITIEASEATEVGWRTLQAKRCTTNCVQATDLTGGINYSIATPLGASMKYTPVAGKISIEYKNMSSEPVSIDIYRVRRTCDAEACTFLDESQKRRWLVFKVGEFTSISTSRDQSYSVISGVAMSGRPFTLTAVWWTDEKAAIRVDCSAFLKRYVDTHVAKEQYQPYIISGQAIGDAKTIVLTSVDTCTPKAPNFGVPDQNVFK